MRVFAPIARPSRRHVGAALLPLAMLGLSSCLDLNPNVEACSVTVAPTNITVPVNGRQPIVGTAFDCKGNSIRNKKISYSTASPSIATVADDGSVIGISVGQTTVTATANKGSATAQVTVTPEMVATVTVNPPSVTLRSTNTRTFTTVLRTAAGNIITKPVRWSSSNTAIARVDANGVVTADRPGQVQIVAEVDQMLGSSTVTVTEIPIASCSLSPLTQKVTVNGATQPTLVIRDSTQAILPQTGRAITWTSSNEVVAGVNGSGLVSARKAGTAKITAISSENPTVNCETTVEVVEARVDRVVIVPRAGVLRIGVPRALGVTVVDSVNNVLSGRIINWTSVNPAIGTVSNAGVLTGHSVGTARFAVNVEGVVDTVVFSVTKVPVAQVRINPLQVNLEQGQSFPLSAIVTDSTGATVTDRPVEWLSSDPTKATVSQTGLVQTLASGSVTITAVSENSSGQSIVNILLVPVDTIQAPLTFTLVRGATLGFTITIYDRNGTEVRGRPIALSSSRPDIASVPSVVTTSTVPVQALSVGETVITLRAVNASFQGEGKPSFVRVIVTAPPTNPDRPPKNP
jgi:uncharacterized protein YjdB